MYEKGTKIDYLKSQIENKLEHSYLKKYIGQINIEEREIIVLDSLLHDFPLPQREKYIITVILIQIALNIHDNVSDDPEYPDHTPERISKQLSVLAGDYYSGLYYLLQSELQDFKMIHTLAVAIKKINELKMRLYYQEYTSLDEFFTIIQQIDSILFTHVAEHLEEYKLHSFISEWLLLNKLVQKRNNRCHTPPFIKKWLRDSTLYSKETIDEFSDKKIASLVTSLQKSLKNIPVQYSSLQTYVTNCLDSINEDVTISIMEEG